MRSPVSVTLFPVSNRRLRSSSGGQICGTLIPAAELRKIAQKRIAPSVTKPAYRVALTILAAS